MGDKKVQSILDHFLSGQSINQLEFDMFNFLFVQATRIVGHSFGIRILILPLLFVLVQ